MKEKMIKVVLREYFDTVAPLLCYEVCPESEQICEQILTLLCRIWECPEQYKDCYAHVVRTNEIQTVEDCILIHQDPVAVQDGIAQAKMDLLMAMEVEVLRIFDREMVFGDVRSRALAGDAHACRLLACLLWLGIGTAQSEFAAVAVWETLAVAGKQGAIKALIYAYGQQRMQTEAAAWKTTLSLVRQADEAFAPVVPLSLCQSYTAEEVGRANLVLYLRQLHKGENGQSLHIPMLYYALHSRDSDRDKLERLSSEQNFNLLLQEEGKSRSKRIGF